MRHSLIRPIKLHVFVGSRRHQKMRMCVIQGCANLWSISMSFLRVACDAARGLLCPKETCKRWTGWKSHYGMVFQTPEDARDQNFRTFSSGKTETLLMEHFGYLLSQNSEQGWQEVDSENDFLSNFERWKCFLSQGCVVNPLWRTQPTKKKVQLLERLGGWTSQESWNFKKKIKKKNI